MTEEMLEALLEVIEAKVIVMIRENDRALGTEELSRYIDLKQDFVDTFIFGDE